MLLHVLRHVDPDHRPLVIEQETGKRTGQFGLSNAGGSQEEEGSDRAVGVGQSRPAPAHRVGHRRNCVVLADDSLMQVLLETDQLLGLSCHELGHRNPRPLRHHLSDVLVCDLLGEHRPALVESGEVGLTLAQVGLEGVDRPVSQLGRLGEVTVSFGELGLAPGSLDVAFEGSYRSDDVLFEVPSPC